ncbi:hypothetical protein [Syntrophorhabdus aromaticivorans]|uniref:hypothetical protein n=1 Tax=Syntrophorhabdus aromaticivorans TaxID=328301 RepID=UPI000425AD34|nr:hypothetical protein [Syntrophorhabdus aromaticivorans]
MATINRPLRARLPLSSWTGGWVTITAKMTDVCSQERATANRVDYKYRGAHLRERQAKERGYGKE